MSKTSMSKTSKPATSKSATFETVDVFTDTPYGGNPLAVVFGAEALSDTELQKIAIEFNYSETTFVLPPENPTHTARVRIFTPGGELPFAGHPNIGTATVLAWRGTVFGKPVRDHVIFEELAGLVAIDILSEGGEPTGARLTAPQPFQTAGEVSVDIAATCLGLDVSDIRIDTHRPMVGSVGLPFVLVELAGRDALERARPNVAEMVRIPDLKGHEAFHCYVHSDAGDDVDIRSRMFIAGHGMIEDPATGSANCALIGLLARYETGTGVLSKRIAQGVEMGRPSLLLAEAEHEAGRVIAVRIAGSCVPMMRGELTQHGTPDR
jgi:trans-2,3-dihydro-3-hydroxyanthranilate isomerase